MLNKIETYKLGLTNKKEVININTDVSLKET